MSRDGLPLSLDAIAGFGDAIVREARHAQAIASLDGSPVPALLEAVHALQAVLLSANPDFAPIRVDPRRHEFALEGVYVGAIKRA